MNINELLISEELQEKISKAQSLEEIVEILAAEGIEIAIEELKAALEKDSAGENGELSEDALDDVSGGASLAGKLIRAVIEILKKAPPKPTPILPRRKK